MYNNNYYDLDYTLIVSRGNVMVRYTLIDNYINKTLELNSNH